MKGKAKLYGEPAFAVKVNANGSKVLYDIACFVPDPRLFLGKTYVEVELDYETIFETDCPLETEKEIYMLHYIKYKNTKIVKF